MELKVIKADGDYTHVALCGRLDIDGVTSVEMNFTNVVSAKGKPAIKSLIPNRDQLKLKDDGSIDGLNLGAVKTSAPYLFDQIETRPEGTPPAGASGSGGKTPEEMSYAEYKAWREKN